MTVKAVAQFVRTMVSSDSKFDLWRRGETELTEEEYNGYQIFLREGGDPEVVPGGNSAATASIATVKQACNSPTT